MNYENVYFYLINSGLIHEMEQYSKVVFTVEEDSKSYDDEPGVFYIKGRIDEYYKDKLIITGGFSKRVDKEYKKEDIYLERTNIPYDEDSFLISNFYNNEDILARAVKDYGITNDIIDDFYKMRDVLTTNHPKKVDYLDYCSKIEVARKELAELKSQLLAKEKELDLLKSKRDNIHFEIHYGMTPEKSKLKSRQ